MKSIVLLLLTLLSLASALRVAMLPMRHVRLATTSRLAMSDAAAEEKEIFPKDADGNTLITYESLDKTGKEMIEMALIDRNKMRILEGQPKYEDVEAMIDAYVEYEGREQGLTRAQCEDAVLRFLQRQALLSEGGADFSDPQTIVTFGLLAAIVLGAGYQLLTGGASVAQ